MWSLRLDSPRLLLAGDVVPPEVPVPPGVRDVYGRRCGRGEHVDLQVLLLFPWSLFMEDIVLMMLSLLSDRDSVSLPESPELREEYPLQSRPSPPFESAGNESRRASGLDTSGGLVLL